MKFFMICISLLFFNAVNASENCREQNQKLVEAFVAQYNSNTNIYLRKNELDTEKSTNSKYYYNLFQDERGGRSFCLTLQTTPTCIPEKMEMTEQYCYYVN